MVRIVQEYIGKEVLLVAEEITGEVFIFASWFLDSFSERATRFFVYASKQRSIYFREVEAATFSALCLTKPW